MKKSSYKKVRMFTIDHFVHIYTTIDWFLIVSVFPSYPGFCRPCSSSTTLCKWRNWPREWRALWRWTGEMRSEPKHLSIQTLCSTTLILDTLPSFALSTLTQASFLSGSSGGRSGSGRRRRRRDRILPSWNHYPLFCISSDRASLFGCKQKVCVWGFFPLSKAVIEYLSYTVESWKCQHRKTLEVVFVAYF